MVEISVNILSLNYRYNLDTHNIEKIVFLKTNKELISAARERFLAETTEEADERKQATREKEPQKKRKVVTVESESE